VSVLDAPGVVTVRTRPLLMGETHWVEVTVGDNGPGIPKEIIDRVFDPFFSTKPVGQGTGLGLFLTYGIVSDHRGKIEVMNRGTGALFSVLLPAVGCVQEGQEEEEWESQAKFS
jgi:signal transduction histidine kinase